MQKKLSLKKKKKSFQEKFILHNQPQILPIFEEKAYLWGEREIAYLKISVTENIPIFTINCEFC